ncbi:MAG TPA: hypothetical protein VF074_12730 [Pyrinomonadaceae bacterium]
MKEEYLWDKSGEPDPEIQQLEEVLGTLKYQPRPLEIPRDLVVIRRRRYAPYLAIAASLIFAILGAGFWLTRLRHQDEPASAVKLEPPQPAPTTAIERQDDNPKILKKESVVVVNQPARHKSSAGRSLSTRLTRKEREEALVAKQQLLLALRVASEKLSLAQKKAVSPTSPGQIRNQHKVG